MIRINEVWRGEVIREYMEFASLAICPVCGNETFDNWTICPHCGWEYDELMHKGYSCANRSYLWWYRLKYKIKERLHLNKPCNPHSDILNPVAHIGSLLGATEDGQLSITYNSSGGSKELTMTYPMDWDFDDACFVARELDNLLYHLHCIFHLSHHLEDREHIAEVLSPELLRVWDTYLAPFEGWDIDEDEIARLKIKENFEGLTNDEGALLAASLNWYDSQCLQRLPYNRCEPTGVIHEARRYYKALSGNCEDDLDIVSYYLAEQMVLYYCKAEHPHNTEKKEVSSDEGNAQ